MKCTRSAEIPRGFGFIQCVFKRSRNMLYCIRVIIGVVCFACEVSKWYVRAKVFYRKFIL